MQPGKIFQILLFDRMVKVVNTQGLPYQVAKILGIEKIYLVASIRCYIWKFLQAIYAHRAKKFIFFISKTLSDLSLLNRMLFVYCRLAWEPIVGR